MVVEWVIWAFRKYRALWLLTAGELLAVLFFSMTNMFDNMYINTVCGRADFSNPLLRKLLQSKAMQRIKRIDQSGPHPYFNMVGKFSRYDHSVGVLALLQKSGASIEEQAAGLMHDVSHTVFSHTGDHLFYKANLEKSYQDKIHSWFLCEMDVDKILSEYGLSVEDVDPDRKEFTAQEAPIPMMCADRIQYNIQTGVIFELLTKKDAKKIVDALEFKNDRWYFTDKNLAKKFAMLPLFFVKNFWNSPEGEALQKIFAMALKQAIATGTVTTEGLHFGIDSDVIKKLYKSDDKYIKRLLLACRNIKSSFSIVKYGDGDFNVMPRFRGIDPLVFAEGKFVLLSEIDPDFKNSFLSTKEWCKSGYGIKILIDTNTGALFKR